MYMKLILDELFITEMLYLTKHYPLSMLIFGAIRHF